MIFQLCSRANGPPRVRDGSSAFEAAKELPSLPNVVISLLSASSFTKVLLMQRAVVCGGRISFDARSNGETDHSEHEQDENGEDANDHHGGRKKGASDQSRLDQSRLNPQLSGVYFQFYFQNDIGSDSHRVSRLALTA